MSFSGAEIESAVAAGERREVTGRESAGHEALESQLINSAQDGGNYLTDADVTVATLREDDVRVDVAVPETIELESLRVIADPEEGTLSVQSRSSEDPSIDSIETAGPGMGNWKWHNEGQYVLKVTRNGGEIGKGLFLWQRFRLANDGSGEFDWWSYTRRGFGQPAEIRGDNWQIQSMRIASYPYDAVDSKSEGLLNWAGMEPAEDHFACSSGTKWHTGFEVQGGLIPGLTFTPHDCSEYDVWFNAEVPGSYRLTYDQGSYVNEGNRAIAYTVAWRSRQGTAGSQHDFQRINFQNGPWGGEKDRTCGSYDKDLTC